MRFGVLPTTRVSMVFFALVCGTMAVLNALGALGPVAFGLLMFLFNCSFLSLMANAASLTLDPHPQIAGLASSIFGFVTQMVPGACTLAPLGLIGGEVGRWATTVSAVTVLLLVMLWFYRPARQMAGVH
jgi:hypothetical protein